MSERVVDLSVGRIVQDRYEILEVLGQGSFGVVYKARQLATGQLVAMKVLHVDPTVGEEATVEIARFEREMLLMGRITHPNIVRLIDSGRLDEGPLFIAMEYVRGEPLGDLVDRRGPLPIRETCRLMLQVLEALRRAHREGVVHRDLKPHNIMVNDPGPRCNAMVLDFGISFITEEARDADYRTLTRRNEMAGTPAYMAPEQLIQGEITPASDLYAWGLVFLETLTGRVAVAETSLVKLVLRYTKGQALDIPEVLRRSPLGRILVKATANELEKRYESVDQVLDDFDRLDLLGPWVRPLEEALREEWRQDPATRNHGMELTATAESPPPAPQGPATPRPDSRATPVPTPRPLSRSAPTARIAGADSPPSVLDERLPRPAASDGTRAKTPGRDAAPLDHRLWIVSSVLLAGLVAAILAVLAFGNGEPAPSGDGSPGGGPAGGDSVAPANAETSAAADGGFALAAAHHAPPDVDRMVRVPAGPFIMGCVTTDDPLCEPDERPPHEVDLDGFDIDVIPVSVEAYARCVEADICDEPESYSPGRRPSCNWGHPDRLDHPVNCVTWYQAQIYCEWLGKRLPTEAEWEKAARGSDGRPFPWGDAPPTCESTAMSDGSLDCFRRTTRPVGVSSDNVSPFGALDMAGNVWEWTQDWYGRDYYASAATHNPTGPPGGDERVVRGGGFDDDTRDMRVSQRNGDRPFETDDDTGFRCVRSSAD